eukprot:1182960-Prorocentrum_minimum.AAC.3
MIPPSPPPPPRAAACTLDRALARREGAGGASPAAAVRASSQGWICSSFSTARHTEPPPRGGTTCDFARPQSSGEGLQPGVDLLLLLHRQAH